MNIISTFASIDGEVNAFGQGRLTTFIRLATCNLRCSYCDTKFSFSGGTPITVGELVDEVNNDFIKKVTLTGGEPLLQRDEVSELISQLVNSGHTVSIETNGTLSPIEEWLSHPQVSWVYDYKLPSSGMFSKMIDACFHNLTDMDYVKFLIGTHKDYDETFKVRERLENSGCRAHFAYSPVVGSEEISADKLVDLLMKHGKGDEILNLQIHKIIWPHCGEEEER